MKKSLIIALLIALVLGVFTACNGDVFAELIGDTDKTITLKIYNHDDWLFDNGTDTLELKVPATCTTWSDLIDKATVTVDSLWFSEEQLTVKNNGGKIRFENEGGDVWADVYYVPKSPGEDTLIDTPVDCDMIYVLYVEVSL